MKKTTYLITLAIAFVCSLSINLFAQDAQVNSKDGAMLTIISGTKGGSYFTMASDIQKMTRKVYGKVNPDTTSKMDTIDFLQNRESSGSYYNFQKINKLDVDITFLQYDVLLYEDMLDLNKKVKKTKDIQVLLPMGVEQIHLITLKGSKIVEFKDLKGKKVGIGSKLQGTYVTSKFLKEKLEGKWEDVEISYDQAFKALFAGTIDAFFFVGAVPVTNLGDLPKAMKDKIKLISLPDNPALKEAYGEMTAITKADYKWLDADIKTYGVRSLLVTTTANMTPEKEQYIVQLLQEIKKNKDAAGYHANWKNVQFKKDEKIDWKYFPAAEKLYN